MKIARFIMERGRETADILETRENVPVDTIFKFVRTAGVAMSNRDVLDDPTIAGIYKMHQEAGKMEARARDIEENGTDFVTPCDSEFEGKYCEECKFFMVCQSHDLTFLFEEAWKGYLQSEELIRREVETSDSEGANAVLAQILMDIHIHPNSGLEQDTITLWEAQYLWLKLYFNTRKGCYLEMARMCEGFRTAYAVLSENQDIEQGD